MEEERPEDTEEKMEWISTTASVSALWWHPKPVGGGGGGCGSKSSESSVGGDLDLSVVRTASFVRA